MDLNLGSLYFELHLTTIPNSNLLEQTLPNKWVTFRAFFFTSRTGNQCCYSNQGSQVVPTKLKIFTLFPFNISWFIVTFYIIIQSAFIFNYGYSARQRETSILSIGGDSPRTTMRSKWEDAVSCISCKNAECLLQSFSHFYFTSGTVAFYTEWSPY